MIINVAFVGQLSFTLPFSLLDPQNDNQQPSNYRFSSSKNRVYIKRLLSVPDERETKGVGGWVVVNGEIMVTT